MQRLPQLKVSARRREETRAFVGLDRRERASEASFAATENLAFCDELISSRPERETIAELHAPQGLLAQDAVCYIDGGDFVYEGHTIALGLSQGEKQLVPMGAYICIFPDKKYVNTADFTDFGDMEARFHYTGEVEIKPCSIDGSEFEILYDEPTELQQGAKMLRDGELLEYSQELGWVTVTDTFVKLVFGRLPKIFSENDAVNISGTPIDGVKLIAALGEDYIVLAGLSEPLVLTDGDVKIERRVPDMDFVCQCRNRLWGCRYGEVNELYACALGDFRNWERFEGLSTDSWRASLGSEGEFTGCVSYLSSPVFFKENCLHRIGISATGAHTVTELRCRGVQKGSHRSLALIDETLFYKSRGEVCAWQGGFPESVSEALGAESYSAAVAGALGGFLYLSMLDAKGAPSLFCYDARRRLWLREDGSRIEHFAAVDGRLLALADDGRLMDLRAGKGEGSITWSFESGILSYREPERKYLSRISIRLSMAEGAFAEAEVCYDSDGVWHSAGRVELKGHGAVTIPLRPRRCDHLRLRLRGRGNVRLFSITRLMESGSAL